MAARAAFEGAAYDVIGIAASAGGLAALERLLGALPADFPAAVVVVQHLDRRFPSHLADILQRRTAVTVAEAKHGDRIEPGKVFIAPPDHHLLLDPDGTLSLASTELVHFVRPSADLLFDSMAASFRERAVGVVVTGSGTDGAIGVQAVKRMGGIVITQDENAEFFGMPEAAIKTGCVDHVLPLDDIAPMLVELVTRGSSS